MRKLISSAVAALAMGMFATGCAGPEQKLGRGISNVTEFARLGEIRRSMEQTELWEGAGGNTTGVIRGLNRSLARTAVGVYEIVTFPFPGYDPVFLPSNPVYPDSVVHGMLPPDVALGFSGGDVAPIIPGSQFRIFDY